jgi:hypothetical protein
MVLGTRGATDRNIVIGVKIHCYYAHVSFCGVIPWFRDHTLNEKTQGRLTFHHEHMAQTIRLSATRVGTDTSRGFFFWRLGFFGLRTSVLSPPQYGSRELYDSI